MSILVICLLMERKSLILKPTIKILTFQRNFVLEAYLMNLVLLRVVSLNGNVYDVSVDYNSIDKYDKLNIH